jgi:hypothetical protein
MTLPFAGFTAEAGEKAAASGRASKTAPSGAFAPTTTACAAGTCDGLAITP